MVRESVRGYLALASGLSEVTATRARAAARALVEQGEATAGQVSALAEDLVATSRRNRESLALLVRHEADQAVRRLGFAPAADNDELTRRVRQLERTVRELQAELRKAETTAASTPDRQRPPGRPAAGGARKTSATRKSTTRAKKSTATAGKPTTRTKKSTAAARKPTTSTRKSATAGKSTAANKRTVKRGAAKTSRAKKRT